MSESTGHIDPWSSVSRLAGGVIVYGGAGYLLDRWWQTSFMVGIGIVVGAALGIYAIVVSLRSE